MEISFDPAKRERTLRERGLDFTDAPGGAAIYQEVDDRYDYGEVRKLSVGHLRGRMVVIVSTERPPFLHIISMRKANDREKAYYGELLARPG